MDKQEEPQTKPVKRPPDTIITRGLPPKEIRKGRSQ